MRSGLETKSNQRDLRYVSCKVIGDLRSMEGITRCTGDLDEGFRRMRIDLKWKISAALGNITNAGRERTGLGLSSTDG